MEFRYEPEVFYTGKSVSIGANVLRESYCLQEFSACNEQKEKQQHSKC
ncbi:MAG: hypothetical protein IPH77_11915 [Ignavibacteria bacterium]|nr:hypothetical protein [Ignavibacteria bacterium]